MEGQSVRRGGVLAGLLLLVLLILVGSHLLSLREEIRAAEAQKVELGEKIAAMEQENAALQAALEKAGDTEYLQELARDQLGLVAPEEKVFYDVSN